MSCPQPFRHSSFATDLDHDLNLDPNKVVAYGFFGRQGGHSKGTYTSLNGAPNSGDNLESVSKNRRLVAKMMCGQDRDLITLNQVHGNHCVRFENKSNINVLEEGDALVTHMSCMPIAILTADCAPVLFHAHNPDTDTRIIGAAHAGWRGALGGVLESVVSTMTQYENIEPVHIEACIGPCISAASYEVQTDFYQKFIGYDTSYAQFFIPNKNHQTPPSYQFDLKQFCVHRLRQAGVNQVSVMPQCTYTQSQDFFSHRRSLHNAEPNFGRQISVIAIL